MNELHEPQVTFTVRHKQPKTIAEAITATLQMHSFLPSPASRQPELSYCHHSLYPRYNAVCGWTSWKQIWQNAKLAYDSPTIGLWALSLRRMPSTILNPDRVSPEPSDLQKGKPLRSSCAAPCQNRTRGTTTPPCQWPSAGGWSW